jgi:hypothetical protein
MAEEEKGSWAGSEWDQGVSLEDLQKEKSVKGQKKNLATAKYKDEDE